MADETLVKLRLQNGRYEGRLNAAAPSGIEVVHRGQVLGLAEVSDAPDAPGVYQVVADLPACVMSDGVQVVSLRSVNSGAVLDRITLMSGSALDEDIRAEVAMLREELEMLKRAFRRHCAETGED